MTKTTIIAFVLFTCLTSFASDLQRGYRGFVDFNADVAFPKSPWGETQTDAYYGLSTSHGYQFNPHLFIGAGGEYELFNEAHTQGMKPQDILYLHGRTDWSIGKVNVYGDLRIGSIINGVNRFYLSPTVGYSFRLGSGSNMYIGAGMNFRRSGEYYNKGFHPQLAMRLGVDFGSSVRCTSSETKPKREYVRIYNPEYKHTPEWRRYKTLNTIGWTFLGVGTASTLFFTTLTAFSAAEGGDAYAPAVVGIAVGGSMLLSSVPLLIMAHNYKNKAKRIVLNADAGILAISNPVSGTKANIPAVGLSIDL